MIFLIIFITCITIIASCIGTVSGFGLSVVMTPLLFLFLPLQQVIFLVSIIHWFHSLWKAILFRRHISWHICICFGIPAMVASFLGAQFLGVGESVYFSRLIGFFFIFYGVLLLVMPTVKLTYNKITAFFGGIVSGFLAGVFGLRGAVRSIFLSMFNLPKMVYLGTTGMVSLIVDSTRLFVYTSKKMDLDFALLLGMIAFIPASFVGSYMGKKLVHKTPQQYFRAILALFLLIIGMWIVYSSLK